jgi:hypothetical protein
MSIVNRRQSTARGYEIENLCSSHDGSIFFEFEISISHSRIRLSLSYFSKLTKPLTLPNSLDNSLLKSR